MTCIISKTSNTIQGWVDGKLYCTRGEAGKVLPRKRIRESRITTYRIVKGLQI